MSETCKSCKNKFDFGIWLSPQFADEKVLLFCSEKCKSDYLKMKLNRIKVEYPKYYDKIKKTMCHSDFQVRGLKKHSFFGCSRNNHIFQDVVFVKFLDIMKNKNGVRPFWLDGGGR